MGIYIKGMDMPKAGELLQVAENVDGTIFVRETTHGEWHQVVEVPKHGRLIDAYKLMDDICSALNEMTRIGIAVDGEWLWGKLNDAIDSALTVIESEE